MGHKKEVHDSIAEMQGRRLQLARQAKSHELEREFTQGEVAEAVGQGLTRAAYQSYESGRHRIPEEYLEPLGAVLGVSPFYLLGLREPEALKQEARLLAEIANEIDRPELLRLLINVATDQLKLDRQLRRGAGQ